MDSALGTQSQELDTSRNVSRSEAFQKLKLPMREDWQGEPSALAGEIMSTPGQEKVVEELNIYEKKYIDHSCMGGLGTFVEAGTASSNISFQNLKKADRNVIVAHANFPPHGSSNPFALSKDGKSLKKPCLHQFLLTVPRIAAAEGKIRPPDVNLIAERTILIDTHCFFADSNCCSSANKFPCPNGVARRDY